MSTIVQIDGKGERSIKAGRDEHIYSTLNEEGCDLYTLEVEDVVAARYILHPQEQAVIVLSVLLQVVLHIVEDEQWHQSLELKHHQRVGDVEVVELRHRLIKISHQPKHRWSPQQVHE